MQNKFATLALSISLLLVSACSHMQLPVSQEMLDAKHQLDEIADKLDATLSVVQGSLVIAKMGIDSLCAAMPGSPVCDRAREVQSAAEGYVKAADDAIDFYRETGTGFDAAMKALNEAGRRVAEFRKLAESLVKSVA